MDTIVKKKYGGALLYILLAPLIQAQPMTVCELLSHLEDLNQQEVRVRGSWSVGHVGEILIATGGCEHRILRDGWLWQDAIEVAPETESVKPFRAEAHTLERSQSATTPGRVVATLTGRIETRDHFDVHKLQNGSTQPIAFLYFVAILRYHKVEDLGIITYKPGEAKRELEIRRRPEARRVVLPKNAIH